MLPRHRVDGYSLSMIEKPAPSLRERNRIRLRQEILDVALDIIDADGITACSVEEIARRIGASKTTVYAQFRGGLDEMLRERYRAISEELITEVSLRRAKLADGAARVSVMADVLFDLCAQPKIGRFYMQLSPALSPKLEAVIGRGSSAFRAMISEDLVASGFEEAEARVRAIALMGAIRETAVAVAKEPEYRDRLLEIVGQIARSMFGLQRVEPHRDV